MPRVSYICLSNTQISPIYQSICTFATKGIGVSAEGQSRTDISCSSDMRHDHLGYRGKDISILANETLFNNQ